MMTRCSWLLAWTAIVALGLVAAGPAPAQASDFMHFNYHKYLPSSARSKIESYVGTVDLAKPKHDVSITVPTSGTVVAAPANSTVVAGPAIATTAAPGKSTCLTKQYLATGAVLFQDVCTREWALNSTTVARHRPIAHNCLAKDRPDNSIVMFRDTCTSEWAMNTLEQQAEAPQ